MRTVDSVRAERDRWIVLRDAAEYLFSAEMPSDFGRMTRSELARVQPLASRVMRANVKISELDRELARLWREEQAEDKRLERERQAKILRAQTRELSRGYYDAWAFPSQPNIGTLAGAAPPWNWTWLAGGTFTPFSDMELLPFYGQPNWKAVA